MQRNRKTHEKNKQLIKTDSEMTQMIELVDKGFKTTTINIFHMFKKHGQIQERWKIKKMNRQVDK